MNAVVPPICCHLGVQSFFYFTWTYLFTNFTIVSILFSILQKKLHIRKPIGSYWFKMSCLTCFVFSCVYCFFLKRWNLYKDICSAWWAVLLPKFLSHRLTSWTSQKYNRATVILRRTLLWIFGKWAGWLLPKAHLIAYKMDLWFPSASC